MLDPASAEQEPAGDEEARAPVSPAEVTLVTTCMGKLDFLRQTLPNWIRATDFSIVVVDYSCPQGTGDWVEASGLGARVRLVRAVADDFQDGVPIFNVSRARNLGVAAVADGFILFADADNAFQPHFQSNLLSRMHPSKIHGVYWDARYRSELGGLFTVHSTAFRAIGGFDENLRGWGSEDCDLKIRLYLHGLRFRRIPRDWVKVHPHSDARRTANYTDKDIRVSDRKNQRYLNKKYAAAGFGDYSRWTRHPDISGRL